MAVNKARRLPRLLEPSALPGRGVQRQKPLSHGERIAERCWRGTVLRVAESAGIEPSMRAHPVRRTPRPREVLSIAGRIVKSRPSGNGPAVLARVNVHVDTGIRAATPLGVTQRIEHMARELGVDIGVLTCVNRALGAGQEMLQIAIDILCRFQIRGIAEEPIAFGVQAHVLRLERHYFLEVR